MAKHACHVHCEMHCDSENIYVHGVFPNTYNKSIAIANMEQLHFTARRKVSFASAVFATAYPSVVHLYARPPQSGIVSKRGNAQRDAVFTVG